MPLSLLSRFLSFYEFSQACLGAPLNKFRVKYADFLDSPFVLHKKDVKIEDGITYLPLYMAPLLVRRDRITSSSH